MKVTGFYSTTLFKKEPPVYVFSKKSLRDVFYGNLQAITIRLWKL